MKKIIQRVLIVLVVLTVAICTGISFLNRSEEKKTEQTAGVPIVTDSQGEAYGAVVNEEGVTYAVVTDADKNMFMAEYDGVTVGSTVTQIKDEVKFDDLPTKYTGPAVAESQNANDYKGEVVTGGNVKTTAPADTGVAQQGTPTTAPENNGTTAAGTPTTAPANNGTTAAGAPTTSAANNDATVAPGTPTKAPVNAATTAAPGHPTKAPSQNTTAAPGKPTTPAAPGTTAGQTGTTSSASQEAVKEGTRIKKYEQIFQSGTYAMTVEMNDPEYPEPVTMALKNGNIFIETAMSVEEGQKPLKMKMLYLKNENAMYLILDDIKKYCKLPEDRVAEFDMGSMVKDFKINTVGEIKSSTANINGKTLNVESFVNEAGETVNYYFDGDNIVRLDTIGKKGKTDSVYYSMFTTDVSDSYFTIPDGYGYWNLSWVGALM